MKRKLLGRKTLSQITTIVSPDSILRWHRKLIATKWDYSNRRKTSGRPRIPQPVVKLVLKFVNENPSLGYDRIQRALVNIGHAISDTSVRSILKANGIEPAPQRKRTTTWNTLLKAHWDVLAAIDSTTVEVWTKSGLVTYYLLFVMDLKSRCVHFSGCTPDPDGAWMKRIARNLSDFSGFLNGHRFLLMDRDTKFCPSFREIFGSSDVAYSRLPKRSPNLNGHIERFMRSIKEETLNRLILYGEGSLRNAVCEFLEHYHGERIHQGLGNRIVAPTDDIGHSIGEQQQRGLLGGMLRYYYRDAA